MMKKTTHITMFFLHKFQEGRHVGSTKVINRPESRKYAFLGQPLEVILANVLQQKSELEN